MNRLGEVLAVADAFSEPQIAGAAEVCRELLGIAREEEAEVLLPVATSAVRDSANADEIVARLDDALGQSVTVLSGLEEARLIFSAFRSRVPWKKGRALGLDLGGGSLEIVLGTTEKVEWEATLPLGAARLARKFVTSDPMAKTERAALKEHVREQIKPILRSLEKQKFKHVIATGGTIGVLTRMLMEEKNDVGDSARGFAIEAPALAQLAKNLCKATTKDRMAMPGMSERRVDLVPTGATIYSVICQALEIEEVTFSDWGLREGVLLEYTGSSLVTS